jgi:hypothetical protein
MSGLVDATGGENTMDISDDSISAPQTESRDIVPSCEGAVVGTGISTSATGGAAALALAPQAALLPPTYYSSSSRSSSHSNAEKIKRKERAARIRLNIQWDEETIAEHNKERGTRFVSTLLSAPCHQSVL